MKKSLLMLLCIFSILAIGSYGLVKLVVPNSSVATKNSDSHTIVTSFYPEYIITMNIIDSIDDINLINMTSETTGCLHDYQLTSKDMKTLTKADALIINGGGMEPFIDDIKKSFKKLPIIDSSHGIKLLDNVTEHSHSHEEICDIKDCNNHSHDKDCDKDNCHDHSHDKNCTDKDCDIHSNDNSCDDENCSSHNHGDFNSHIWLNPDNYINQINTITKQLCTIYPAYKDTFKSNAKTYISKVNSLKKELTTASSLLEDKLDVILFHDSFAYLADVGKLNIVDTVNISSDTALSAGTIANIITEVKIHKIKVLLCEKQFKDTIADGVSKETNAKVYTLDSLVSGKYTKDAYLKGMKKNITTLKQLY